MKLSKENIQFIDTYLKNSNVIYIDIRFEMIDHIATAVEEKMEVENLDFYDAFKKYMIENKTELIINNRASKFFSWTEISIYLKQLIHPTMLLVAVLLFITHKYIDINRYFSEVFTFNNLVFIIFIAIMLFQTGYHYLYVKKKYYGIEKTSQILMIIYLLLPFLQSKNIIISLIFIYLLVVYLFYFYKETSKFKKHKYNFAKT